MTCKVNTFLTVLSLAQEKQLDRACVHQIYKICFIVDKWQLPYTTVPRYTARVNKASCTVSHFVLTAMGTLLSTIKFKLSLLLALSPYCFLDRPPNLYSLFFFSFSDILLSFSLIYKFSLRDLPLQEGCLNIWNSLQEISLESASAPLSAAPRNTTIFDC